MNEAYDVDVLLNRILQRTAVGPEGCWVWQGPPTTNGYGRMTVTTKRGVVSQKYVHRLAYELLVGPIPNGKELDHLCRNRMCCNPSHLEAVTHQENLLRGERATSSTCKRGHLSSEHGATDRRGNRRCKRCHADRQTRRRAQLRVHA